MSANAISAVWEASKMTGERLLVLVAIADNLDDQFIGYINPEFIALKTHMSDDDVINIIQEIERSGEIEVYRINPVHYQINMSGLHISVFHRTDHDQEVSNE
jgi:hypothetical protein